MNECGDLAIASNGVIEGKTIIAIVTDDEGTFYIISEDMDIDLFSKMVGDFDSLCEADQALAIEAFKPVCLHCLAEHHPDCLEALAVAKEQGEWFHSGP